MTFAEAMQFQATFCDRNGAPLTAACCRTLPDILDNTSVTGRRAIDWPGDPIRDALPLRLVAPLHALHRNGVLTSLADADAVRRAIFATDEWIADWLNGPPQTNEPARSATFMAGLLVLAARFDLPFDLLEIGSSAGLNLLINRYRYDLGSSVAGPVDAPVQIRPEWRGRAPPSSGVRIVQVRGVDISPLDVTNTAVAERLMAYIWIDAPERLARVERAVAMLQAEPVDLVQGNAADWTEAHLAEPHMPGTCRVLMHSVVWPYLDDSARQRIVAALEVTGAHATAAAPLAWLRMEWDIAHTVHRIRMRCWPDGTDQWLGNSHPHSAWIEWLA